MLPPFYYKGVSDEGLYRVLLGGDPARRRCPAAASTSTTSRRSPRSPITQGLIERLLKDYPDTVAGMKDSSGDWNNTKAIIEAFPRLRRLRGLGVVPAAAHADGGAGCITATANVNPAAIHNLFATWQESDADEQQADLTALRGDLAKYRDDPGAEGDDGPLFGRRDLGAGAPAAGRTERCREADAGLRARRTRLRHAGPEARGLTGIPEPVSGRLRNLLEGEPLLHRIELLGEVLAQDLRQPLAVARTNCGEDLLVLDDRLLPAVR